MDTLPEATLGVILSFVGDAEDFQNCEKTCKAFCQALKDDSIWAICEECKPKYQNQQGPHWPTLHRERVFVVRALHQCHNWQNQNDPVLLSVLSVREWRTLVGATLLSTLTSFPRCNHHSFVLRGDTSAVLVAIVERCLITQLRRALSAAKHRCSDHIVSQYFSVSVKDFELYHLEPVYVPGGEVQNTLFAIPEFGVLPANPKREILYEQLQRGGEGQQGFGCFGGVSKRSRDRIVRRLSYQAGITQMDNDLFDLVWATLLHLVHALTKPARSRVELPSRLNCSCETVVLNLQAGESMWDIPPPPKFLERLCEACGERHVVHTIVPGQVEDGAKALGILGKVFIDSWHFDEDEDASLVIQNAEDMYCSPDGKPLSEFGGSVMASSHTIMQEMSEAYEDTGGYEDDSKFEEEFELDDEISVTSLVEAWALGGVNNLPFVFPNEEDEDFEDYLSDDEDEESSDDDDPSYDEYVSGDEDVDYESDHEESFFIGLLMGCVAMAGFQHKHFGLN